MARELGADPTAVYRHFHDRNELVEACLDRLLADVTGSVTREQPWRERLSALALAYFEAIVSHPVIGAEAGHRPPPDRVSSRYSRCCSLRSSMAAADAAHRLQDNRIQLTRDRIWVGTQGLYDPDHYPTAIELREELATLRTDDVFASGFEMLLDAVEAAIDRA